MKLMHAIRHFTAEASGPSYSVPRLCESLAARGNMVTLACHGAGKKVPGVNIVTHSTWPVLRGFAISPAHALALRRAATEFDVVHSHSLWSMSNLAVGFVVPGRRAKLVASPRGTLAPWALSVSKHKKLVAWPIQRRSLHNADLLHATSEEEYQQIRAQGFRAPVAIIPNGIDLPELKPRTHQGTQRTLLFLARIHPIKAIEHLLDAWAPLEAVFPDWRLVIAGPGEEDYVNTLRQRAIRNGSSRVEMTGAIYGADKSQVYRDADLFVLPTHSENFGMVVAEALAHECPAVVSRGAPWAGITLEGCGWWISNAPESIRAALSEGMSLSTAELHAMGARGRQWMAREFGWASVGERMEGAYRWLLEGGQAPSWIRVE